MGIAKTNRFLRLRYVRCRKLFGSDRLEHHSHRCWDRFTKGDGFAVGYRGQKADCALRCAGNRAANDLLVPLIAKSHGKNRAALGENRWVEFAGTLRNNREIDTVFPALLGDTRDSLACWPEAGGGVGRNVAMSFLTNNERLHAPIA